MGLHQARYHQRAHRLHQVQQAQHPAPVSSKHEAASQPQPQLV